MAKKVKPGPPPKEALDYFAAKGLKVGFNYTDVWKEEHNAAFTAAKIVELEVLATLRGIVERSLEEGTTFEQFQKDVGPLLDKSGWSDYHEETPTKVRLRTIFDTNMRTARAAGQWQRIDRTKRLLPFLVYELGPSVRHRPVHASWEGTTLPATDPWWDEHMTPNGWGCKCTIRQIGKREAEREGGVTPRPPSHKVTWRLPDGTTERVPVGIDPGWDYNPGKNRMTGLEAGLANSEAKTK